MLASECLGDHILFVLDDGLVSSFLQMGLSTRCTLPSALGYLGSIRFWEVAVCWEVEPFLSQWV